MDRKRLNEILAAHKAWLEGKAEGLRANLRGAVLQGAVLQGVDLRGAVLQGVDLRKAVLQGACLRGAVLQGAVLQGVDLRKAVLQGVDLRKADLRGACLQGASLRGACLRGAVLQGAVLQGVNLRKAVLQGVDLRKADLRGADIDYSCWPLWCGSLSVKVDARIAAQLAYHFCRLDCDDPGYIAARNAILDFANTFHRAEECGELEPRRNADC